MPDQEPEPSNWSLALRQQRLDLIRRVLETQALFLRNWGREPTAEEVACELDGRMSK